MLQFAEDLIVRLAAEAARTQLDWQYALSLPLDDPGFDHSVLSEFGSRPGAHGLKVPRWTRCAVTDPDCCLAGPRHP